MKLVRLAPFFFFTSILFLTQTNVFSSFPTNRNVTAVAQPISPGNPNKEVIITVVDDQRNQTITWRSPYIGNLSNPTIQDGLVSWAETYGTSIRFHYAVYDAGCGCVKTYYTLYSPGNVASITRGGVVFWDTIEYPFGNPPAYIQHHWAIYDPETGNWVFSETASSPRNTGGALIRDTAIAWAELYNPPGYPNDPTKIIFHFHIYDPQRKQWKQYTSNIFDAPGSSYNLVDGTGLYTANGTSYKAGYNSSTGNWVFNAFTTPFSYFVTSNPTGNTPLKTYFWDMSLGASQWNWLFGDGGGSSERSPFYTYNSVVGSPYIATLTATGPGGSSSQSRTITPTTPHSISGTVANTSGFKISGATVTLTGTLSKTTQTDTNGNYSFVNLTGGGNYTVAVSKLRYKFVLPTRTFSNLSGSQTGNFTGKLNNTIADFDGDAKTDISVFRPSDGTWYLNRSTDGFTAYAWGVSSDIITPGDFDGDGKADIAIFRPSTGAWWILNSSNSQTTVVSFGQNGDIPVQADYDGDGKADIAVWRPSDGVWYRQNSSNGVFIGYQFGTNGDRPAVGDYDGDGRYDYAVFRPSSGVWYLQQSTSGFATAQWGLSGDKITPADYDGDGKTDISVWRPSDGIWYRVNSSNGAYVYSTFGTNGDIPAPGDYDADGKYDYAVFRPSNGVWYLQQSTSGFFTIQFGLSGDLPTPSAFVH